MRVDMLLAKFVDMVDEGGGSFPITVSLKGLLVSGRLVGRQEWLQHLVVEWHRAVEKVEPGSGKWLLDLEEKIARTRPGEPLEGEVSDAFAPTAHLKDAQVVVPGMRPMPANGMWLRVRLDEVDAFAFGQLGVAGV